MREVVYHVVQCIGLPCPMARARSTPTPAEAGVLLHVNRSRLYLLGPALRGEAATEQSHAAQGAVMEAAGVACGPIPSSAGPCNVACSLQKHTSF